MASSHHFDEGSFISRDTTTSTTTKSSFAFDNHIRLAIPPEKTHQGKNRLFYCSHCEWSGQSTTNARQHLLRKHDIVVDRAIHATKAVLDQTAELDSQVLKKVLVRDTINSSLLSLIILHNIPFRLVESNEFHTFCKALNPEAIDLISSHSTLRLQVGKAFTTHKDVVRKKLQSAISAIHISLDVWTSPNQKLFLGICAQFVEYDTEQLVKALIALPSIRSYHAEVQYEALLKVLEDFGIYHKLGAIIADNASSNDKLCRFVGQYFEKEGIWWNAVNNRIRCNGHIINLAVQAFLFQKENTKEEEEKKELELEPTISFRNLGPLGKLHNIVVHIRGSPARITQFKELAGRMIPLDNSTRWNSWYEMVNVAIEKESAIDTYSKTWFEDLKLDFLSPQEWKILQSIQSFLKPFFRATKDTEGDSATIDRILLTMDVLVQHYKKSHEVFKSDPFLVARIDQSWKTFDKYYLKTEDSPYYVAAIVLHPSRKSDYLKYNWEKKWIKPALQAVKNLWSEFKQHEEVLIPEAVTPKVTHKAQQDQEDDYDILLRNLQNFPRPPSKDEYDEYLSEPILQITGSALSWWLQPQQRLRWPKLSQLAINILSIPAMSAEPERVFSGARRTISWERMRLGELTIEMLECLKHWIRSGLTAEVGFFDDMEEEGD